MSDIAELHAQALDHTGRVVAGIAPDRWQGDTPCAGWDVRALLNHLVAGNLWAAELGAGETIEGVGDRLDGDVLGADPAAGPGRTVRGVLRPGARFGLRRAPVRRRLRPRLGPGHGHRAGPEPGSRPDGGMPRGHRAATGRVPGRWRPRRRAAGPGRRDSAAAVPGHAGPARAAAVTSGRVAAGLARATSGEAAR